VFAETVGVTLGIATGGAWIWFAAALCLVILLTGLRTVAGADRGLLILFLAGIVLIPGLMVAIEMRDPIIEPRFFPRYFLVSITLFLLLAAWLAGEQYHRVTRGRIVSTLLVSLYVLGNLWQVAQFARIGRGHYRDALRYIAHETPGPDLRVSSNSDFRTGVLLGFYQRYLPADKHLAFYGRGSARSREAQWRIVEDIEPTTAVPTEIDDGLGDRFRLIRTFPFYGLSGCQWSLYARIAAAADDAGRPPRRVN
jgi:hypothetical protein